MDDWFFINGVCAIFVAIFIMFLSGVTPCKYGKPIRVAAMLYALCFGLLGFSLCGAFDGSGLRNVTLAIVDSVFVMTTLFVGVWIRSKISSDLGEKNKSKKIQPINGVEI